MLLEEFSDIRRLKVSQMQWSNKFNSKTAGSVINWNVNWFSNNPNSRKRNLLNYWWFVGEIRPVLSTFKKGPLDLRIKIYVTFVFFPLYRYILFQNFIIYFCLFCNHVLASLSVLFQFCTICEPVLLTFVCELI